MNDTYRAFFGLQMEPFRADVVLSEIMETHDLLAVHERFGYAVRLGAVALVSGEIGSGKTMILNVLSSRLRQDLYTMIKIHTAHLPFERILMEINHQLRGAEDETLNDDKYYPNTNPSLLI